ncbi:PREDICTED: glucose-fructose oxidoreductase domain-containing protein 1-like [Tinamus guttatus]|uniref:glucose-fructose oxidoreductase domain-containing protein 1-like n=1 Tax=Tinamus guttatus TaxID=94827 RepID=UPI00052E92B9|nr:PREDICTED: glucose-fructose oxidoreductase domain-containing protein 1-like [Tinamus guttatus]
MLPGVGVFGTGLTARVIVPLLKAEGFAVKALWGRTAEEAEELAKEMSVPFHTSRIDEVLLHHDVDLVCINLPPPLTRQVAVKTLGNKTKAFNNNENKRKSSCKYKNMKTGCSFSLRLSEPDSLSPFIFKVVDLRKENDYTIIKDNGYLLLETIDLMDRKK